MSANFKFQISNPVVVALDVDTAAQALALVEQLRGAVGMFKVGKQLFTAAGPDIVRQITAQGERVFLDLKFHDIPNTVAKAGIEAARLGVSIFNVHAAGGSQMLRTVAHEVAAVSEKDGLVRPQILGVTVLTSMTVEAFAELGINRSLAEQVIHLAQLCDAAGIDGVVASPHEITPIRQAVTNPNFIVLTPGVRPAGAALNDQARVMTPAEAIKAGASYLVIGRPIIAANDPRAAAEKILQEIELADSGNV
ncbi:MAG: orotidine-5'-phosphate decarboxylase [Acidobacteria bacterium]|nr:orotidine-5'-phosphate decarboxylase [Acidobacteriota bacterium]